jgi:hypothetical protein
VNRQRPPEKGPLFIALGIVFGIAAVLILVLRAAKIGG